MSADTKKWCTEVVARAKELLGKDLQNRRQISRMLLELNRALNESVDARRNGDS